MLGFLGSLERSHRLAKPLIRTDRLSSTHLISTHSSSQVSGTPSYTRVVIVRQANLPDPRRSTKVSPYLTLRKAKVSKRTSLCSQPAESGSGVLRTSGEESQGPVTMFGLPIGRRVAPLLVFSDYDYRCAPQETHASPLSPPHMKPAVQAAHGSSLFRKKSRFTTGSTSFARDASNGDPAASLSPPNDRPLTSSAQSRRGSRGSSISSINDLNPAALRRRSTSFRKNPQASISTDMLASAGGRDNRYVDPTLVHRLS